ncbi:D-tyrosyl-tRNA(Tyr) deacylase [Sporobolomyces koalae]|uniref:D-tyrosyl-tRNA(Tyr) deacylase n=1 Tax=Sporobolomyces koalae TaxID=500713 RepID=UPI00316BDEEA
MRAVLQRCTSASVTVDGQVISSIGRGVLCLIGIGTDDTTHESEWLASKILGMRLFPDDQEGESWGWKKSVVDAGYEVLCVSQFTLMANLKKGSKPDFHGAMGSETSKAMYEDFLQDLRSKYQSDKIQDGRFGAMMDVQLTNDGPVTLILDSTTDAPARPTAKTRISNELKQQRKQELEAKAREKAERKQKRINGEERHEEPTRTKRDEVLQEEKDLIAEAEKKSQELAERFKVAMTESY